METSELDIYLKLVTKYAGGGVRVVLSLLVLTS